MKVKITKEGLFGVDGPIPVGTVVDVSEEPTAWGDRYEVVSGPTAGKTAVTPEDDDPRLTEIRRIISEELNDDEYTSDGRPQVDAINALLPEGMEPLTAKDRDSIWKSMED